MAQAFLNVTQPIEAKNADVARFIERSLAEYDIPEGVKVIGTYAFCYCTALKRVTIPESVTAIYANAFRYTGLTELVLPTNCSLLESYALYESKELKILKAGNLKKIKNNVFDKNTKCVLYDFTNCTEVPQLDNVNAFGSINPEAKIYVLSHLYNEWIEATNWVELADHIIPAEHSQEVAIPEYSSRGLATYGYGNGECAVTGRGECTDSVVVITDECASGQITNILDGAFLYDGDIEELFIMGSVKSIGNTVCNGSGLKKLYMENVRSVLSIAFMCDNLEYVRFSSNIQYIGGKSFVSNGKKTVYDFTAFTGDSIPELEWEAGVPGSTLSPEKILVPIDRYNEWRSATNWSYYADKIFPAK